MSDDKPDTSLITNSYIRPEDDAVLYMAGGQWYELHADLRVHLLTLKPCASPFLAKVHQR